MQLITYATTFQDSSLHFIGNIPLWLALLWVAFATTLHHSFYRLYRHPFIAALCGLILVPFSYYGGSLLFGARIATPLWLLFVVVGLMWAILLPLHSGLLPAPIL